MRWGPGDGAGVTGVGMIGVDVGAAGLVGVAVGLAGAVGVAVGPGEPDSRFSH